MPGLKLTVTCDEACQLLSRFLVLQIIRVEGPTHTIDVTAQLDIDVELVVAELGTGMVIDVLPTTPLAT